ncbi:MAG: tol-pal system protein YbgF [Nitrospirota bacterium]|nr:tol-pal system protein YbgF [Nitrospirota bacterium]MDH5574908.1 tol-pal system protein YbgF [Nitrospirota bacterium]
MLIPRSLFGRWTARVVILGLGAMVVGCVAQQADVVRIKRELDAKISQLDKSKTSLQEAVNDANEALGKANILITQQRAEIKELLHARAEVMDQMATLKDTDLSQVRGAIEKNQHQVNELNQKLARYDTEMKEVRTQLQQSEPLVHQLRDRVAGEEQLLTEQGGKLGEFRTSLVDYQQVLASLRQQVAQQEQQVAELRKQMELTGQKYDAQGKQVQANFEEVRRSIQSVVGTLEKVSTTFGGRLDEHEQKLSRVVGQQGGQVSYNAPVVKTPELSARTAESRALLSSITPQSSRSGGSPRSESSQISSQPVAAGAVAAYAPSAHPSRTVPPLSGVPPTASPGRVEVRDPRVTYDGAMNLLRQGNFMEAANGFSTFLRTFSDSPLAANAQYWLGECYYGERRFQESIDEFERVFAFYPSSNKVPASLLKIAYAHLELRQPSMARSVFQQLVRTFPQSSEADKAHVRLQEVNALLENPS